ncbi:hypothetical protein OH687_34930 [Burkholderia anthina]|nr:hypothetical protein OH687_34930 [Burkholderia anthina]
MGTEVVTRRGRDSIRGGAPMTVQRNRKGRRRVPSDGTG